MSPIKPRLAHIIFKVLVISVNLSIFGTIEVVPPVIKASNDAHHFFVVNRIVAFGVVKFSKKKGN